MNWKQSMTDNFGQYGGTYLYENLIVFIETEIIEKLIEDVKFHSVDNVTPSCHAKFGYCQSECTKAILNTLKTKWLGEK